MKQADIEASRQAVDMGHLLALGVMEGSQLAAHLAGEACLTAANRQVAVTSEAAGVLHATAEIGRWALSDQYPLELELAAACAGCEGLAEDGRYCSRIGRAIAAGDLDTALTTAIEFDELPSETPVPEHLIGIALGTRQILGTMFTRRAIIESMNERSSQHASLSTVERPLTNRVDTMWLELAQIAAGSLSVEDSTTGITRGEDGRLVLPPWPEDQPAPLSDHDSQGEGSEPETFRYTPIGASEPVDFTLDELGALGLEDQRRLPLDVKLVLIDMRKAGEEILAPDLVPDPDDDEGYIGRP